MSHPSSNKVRFTEADRLQKIREHNARIQEKRRIRDAEKIPVSIKRIQT